MSCQRSIFLFLAIATTLCAGESRTWRNEDDSKRFEAEFISRENDEVTLLRSDGKELSFTLEKLHEEDRRWLDLHHPATIISTEETAEDTMPEADAVFDTLVFGEDRETVGKKLKASKFVESTVDATFLGRTGLNGIYRTKHKIGGLCCFLFFDWTETGGLREITLQTENKNAGEYTGVLKPCWEEFIPLISSIHGKPKQAGNIAAAESLKDGQMLASCLWEIETGGSVLLGTARQGMGYQVVVRFTEEKIGSDKAP